ncbi:MAG: hypothetical protein V5B60_14455 [Accumulibacter sp.]|jgi:hypothetical protein
MSAHAYLSQLPLAPVALRATKELNATAAVFPRTNLRLILQLGASQNP